MKKTILTIAGSALIILSATQFASAAGPQHRAHHRTYTEFRDSNALALPAYEAAPAAYRYGGGVSAPAGR